MDGTQTRNPWLQNWRLILSTTKPDNYKYHKYTEEIILDIFLQ